MPELYGNTQGLSPSAKRTLERIYRRKVPIDVIASSELIRSLVEGAREAGRQVGALVHRSGQVDYVVIGDSNKLMLPDIGRLRAAEGRFRGLRLIHTHLFGEALTKDDLVDLVRMRLDLVAALMLAPDGEVRALDYAHNVPRATGGLPYRVSGPTPLSRLDVDFGALIEGLEAEFARNAKTREVRARDGRAIILHVGDKKKRDAEDAAEAGLRELRELCESAGLEVVDAIVQLRDAIDPRLVVGRGKLDDVLIRAAELESETLVFDRNLTPSQSSALAKLTDLKILDRTQIILDIFAQRAESRDGKLQVELAQLKYSLPRLAMKDDSLSRLTGGIGGRGPGETKLEIGRRRAKERVEHLESQLKKLSRQREERRRRRSRQEVPTVSIVGYTNAGKSTLLNTLTRSDVVAEDKLFATLDTRSRRLRFPEEREVVLTDTVGFIRDLPKDLFAAFRATFEEAADADLLLHVIDASDSARDLHTRTTEGLLHELGLADVPIIRVYNKADLLAPGEGARLLEGRTDAILVSATHRETTRDLLEMMSVRLKPRFEASFADVDHDRPEDDAQEHPQVDEDEQLTLESMLSAGKRRKHRGVKASS